MSPISPLFQSESLTQFNLSPHGAKLSGSENRSSLSQRIYKSSPAFIQSIFNYFSSPEPFLYNVQTGPKNSHPLSHPLVVFGDVHGELIGLHENLINAQLIDQNGNWIGGKQVFVQLGDVIDRGAFSEECWLYLENLQQQALSKGGQVIRLIGNHELNLLEGKKGLASFFLRDVSAFTEKLKTDILQQRVQLAYTDGKRLFLHAGLRSSIRHLLIKELITEKGCSPQDIYLEDLVEYINQLLIKAVQSSDFSHPIFQAGYLRGGEHSKGGLLWADIQELIQSKNARDVAQVIGHNPPRHAQDAPIRITDSQQLIAADAGMNALYGGKRAYVIFKHPNVHVRVKDNEQQIWIEQIALDALNKN